MRTGMLIGMSALIAVTAAAQTVPGYTVQEYAQPNGPVKMTFAPDGTMYVGRDLTLSGGGPGTATRIHEIGPGGAPVVEYGDLLPDPDSVLYDATGTYGGTAGSIVVVGYQSDFDVPLQGYMAGIAPDETTSTLYTNAGIGFNNINGIAMNSANRLILEDDDDGDFFYLDPGDTVPTPWFTSPSPGGFDLNTADQIYQAGLDGNIRLFDSDGTLLNGSFYTLTASTAASPIAVGPGNALWGDDIYTIDRATGELLRITPAGVATPIGTGFGLADRLAADIAFGPDGAMYMSFLDEDRIIRIIPEPASLTLIGLMGLLALRRR